jgi:hypothetical protein
MIRSKHVAYQYSMPDITAVAHDDQLGFMTRFHAAWCHGILAISESAACGEHRLHIHNIGNEPALVVSEDVLRFDSIVNLPRFAGCRTSQSCCIPLKASLPPHSTCASGSYLTSRHRHCMASWFPGSIYCDHHEEYES